MFSFLLTLTKRQIDMWMIFFKISLFGMVFLFSFSVSRLLNCPVVVDQSILNSVTKERLFGDYSYISEQQNWSLNILKNNFLTNSQLLSRINSV